MKIFVKAYCTPFLEEETSKWVTEVTDIQEHWNDISINKIIKKFEITYKNKKVKKVWWKPIEILSILDIIVLTQ